VVDRHGKIARNSLVSAQQWDSPEMLGLTFDAILREEVAVRRDHRSEEIEGTEAWIAAVREALNRKAANDPKQNHRHFDGVCAKGIGRCLGLSLLARRRGQRSARGREKIFPSD